MTQHFTLPKRIEDFLATLSKLYAVEGKRELQEIIVNAKAHVEEGWEHDNLDGGIDGHAVFLTVQESLFLTFVRDKTRIESTILTDLRELNNNPHEYFCQVTLDFESDVSYDWRAESGLLRGAGRSVTSEAENRIWEDGCYRVFLSHKSGYKSETHALKTALRPLGISAFVAHDDVQPTKDWQDEIENALASADALVALLTVDFHESDWTDQEIGYALGRGIPRIAVNLGRDPYGFIGRFQGLKKDWRVLPLHLTRPLLPRQIAES